MSASRRGIWAPLVAVTLIALALVVVPLFLIRPFSPQSPTTMALAYALRRWSPLLTVVALAAAILFAARLWNPGPRILARSGAVLSVALVGATAWAARQNPFEGMFAPLPGPGFVRASDADFVAPADMVMTVALHGDRVAYPIRQLGYHHLVQDSVGGVPIVATY